MLQSVGTVTWSPRSELLTVRCFREYLKITNYENYSKMCHKFLSIYWDSSQAPSSFDFGSLYRFLKPTNPKNVLLIFLTKEPSKLV